MPFGGPYVIPSITGQTGSLQTDGSTIYWGAGTGATYPTAINFAALPPASSQTGNIYVVLNSTGIYIINRKEAGMYYSNGSTWVRLGDIPSFFNSNNFQVYDGIDNTKIATLNINAISTGTTRTYTLTNANQTLLGASTIANQSVITTNSTGTVQSSSTGDGLLVNTSGILNIEPAYSVGYYNDTTQTLAVSGQTYRINYGTQIYDTNSAVTTGSSWVFTAPRAGLYHFDASAGFRTQSTTTAVGFADIFLNFPSKPVPIKDMVTRSTIFNVNAINVLRVSGVYRMTQGETVTPNIAATFTGAAPEVFASADYNKFFAYWISP